MAYGTVMHGKVCVVTGASSGIGRVTALGLAERGATVVLICRNEERGGPVLEEIERRGGSGNAILLTADLSSQRQVRQVAVAFLERFDRLDVLINNAGIAGWGTRLVTEDGLETTLRGQPPGAVPPHQSAAGSAESERARARRSP